VVFINVYIRILEKYRACCWLRQYGTSRKAAGSISDEVIGFFNSPNPSSHTMALGSTRNFPWGKGRPARKADNFTAICELTI
jgi:hypothetical protein